MSEANDFHKSLKGLGEDTEALRDENQALRTRLATFADQAEAVVQSYDAYLEAKVAGRLDDIKGHSNLFTRYLSGLDLLAKRERIFK